MPTIAQSIVDKLPQKERRDIHKELFRRHDNTVYEHIVYMVGYYEGWLQYDACLRAQQSIKAGKQSQARFTAAIECLPRLQHVSYSDFRALAYAEESYADLCTRLFGDVVCPKVGGYRKPTCSAEFLTALCEPRRGSWASLTIGNHPFVSNRFDRLQEGQDWTQYVLEKGVSTLPPVHTLRLRVACGDDDERGSAVRGLNLRTMSRLRELELVHKYSDSYHRKWGGYRWELSAQAHDHHDVDEGEEPDVFFQQLLVARREDFKTLRILTLRNFVFGQAAMYDLLLGLKGLRTLHLLDCISHECYEAFLQRAKEAVSVSLRLTGVEIYGLKFQSYLLPQPSFDQDMRDRMRTKRNLDYDRAGDYGILVEFYPYTTPDWPCERPELEDAMLGGRPNDVLRKARAAPNQEARNNWAKTPVEDL